MAFLSQHYDGPVKTALFQIVGLSVVSLLMLDMGVARIACGSSLIAFCVGAALAITRRRKSAEASDVLFIRWGFPCLFALSYIACVFIQR